MKIKQIMSAVLAGVVTLSSSYVTQLPMAAMAEEYDLPIIPAEVNTIDARIFEDRATKSGESFEVNLMDYGIMTEDTVVEITCTVDKTGIRFENGKTPQWAFGVAIDVDGKPQTIPCCVYDSSKTVFSCQVTAETLKMNPRFRIQHMLPCASEMTVTARNLQKDNRGVMQLPELTQNIELNAYSSERVDGNLCGGSVYFDVEIPEGMTIGDLRSAYNKLAIPAVPFWKDSLGIGADQYCYSFRVDFYTTDGQWSAVSGGEFDLTEAGVIYTDEFFEDSYDDFFVDGIGLNIEAKSEWDKDLKKYTAINTKVHDLILYNFVCIEIKEDTRPDLVLPRNTEFSVAAAKYPDDGGDYLEARVPQELGALEGIKLGEFMAKYHTVTFPAPGHYANSVNADPHDFMYTVDLHFENEGGGSSVSLCSTSEYLDTDSKLYTCFGLEDDFGKDFTLKGISLVIDAVPEYDPETDSDRIKSEVLRNLESYTEFIIEFREDTRSEVTATVPTEPVKMDVWQAVQEEEVKVQKAGMDCGGTTSALTVPGVTYGETTFGQYAENIKSLTATLPYYSDSIEAGKDIFLYRLIFAYDGGEVTDWNICNFDETLTVSTDDLDLDGLSDKVIDSIYLQIEAKFEFKYDTGYEMAADAINALNAGDVFYIEPVKDTREVFVPNMVYLPEAEMRAYTPGQLFDGSFVSAEYYFSAGKLAGLTAEELRKNYKSVKAPAPGYVSDSLNLGSDAYGYELCLVFSDKTTGELKHVIADQASLEESMELPTVLIDVDRLKGCVLKSVLVRIGAAYTITETGKFKAVYDEISTLNPDDEISVVLFERAELILNEVGGTVEMFPMVDSSKYIGTACSGHTDPYQTDGVVYGETTIGEFVTSYGKVICNTVPYFANSLGADRGSFVYRLVILTDDGRELNICGNFILGDSVIFDIIYDTYSISAVADLKIAGIVGYIEPVYESSAEHYYYAADEKLRDLDPESTFFIYLSDVVPENVRAVAGDGEVTITWDEIKGASQYVIKDGGSTVLAKGIKDTTYTFTGLENGTAYSYTVYANIGGTWTMASAKVTATPKVSYIPKNVKAFAADDTVTLTWDAVEGATTYTIKDGGTTILAKGIKDTTYTFTGLDDGATYTYTVFASVNGKWSGASKPVSVVINVRDILTLPEFGGVVNMAAYPAPPDDGYIGNRIEGTSDLFIVDGIEWGVTTLGDFIRGYRKVVADNVPGFSNSLGVDREAFTYQIGLEFGESQDWILSDPVTLGDNTEADIPYDTVLIERYGDSKITGFRLHIKAKYETTEDGSLMASDETLRSCDNMIFYLYPSEVKVKVYPAHADDGEVTLAWDTIKGVSEYVIRDGDSNVVADGICNAFYTITGLTNFKTYTFTVYAKIGNEWASSDPVSATPTGSRIPQNVKAAAGDGEVTLTWDAVNGATTYVIKDGGTTVLAKGIKDTTYTITGLTNGKTYTFTVYAYAGGKWSAASAKVTATPTIVPQNVKAEEGDFEITVTWDEVEGATAYTIKDGGSTVLAKGIKDTTYTFKELEGGKTYTYTVFAYVNGKWSTASKPVSAVPRARGDLILTAPGGMVEMTAYDQNGYSGAYSKGYSDTLEVDGIVYGETTYGDFIRNYKSIICNSVPYFTNSLGVDREAFEYKIELEIEGGLGIYFGSAITLGDAGIGDIKYDQSEIDRYGDSKIVGIRFLIAPKFETTDDGTLTASDETLRSLDNDTKYYIYLSEVKPENVKAFADDGRVTVVWDTIDGATEYVIKDGDSNVVAEGIDGIANYYTITGLTNFKTYTYTVYARLGDGGLSLASDPVSAKPTGNTIPQNVTAAAGNGKVTLTWDAINGAAYYTIKDGGSTVLAKRIKDTTYTITGLTNGKTYTFTVYAYAGGKWSVASAKVTATPTIVPQNVKAEEGDFEITVTWDEVEGATAYTIKDGGSTVLAKSIKDTTYTFKELEGGKTYTYTVFAYVNGKWSTASAPVSAVPRARGDLILTGPGGMVTMSAYYKNGYSGVYSRGYSEPLEVDGIVYGETTVGDLIRNYKSIICNSVPYFTNSLGVDREAFEYIIELGLERGFVNYFGSAVTLGDAYVFDIGYDRSEIDFWENYKIVGIKLLITPKFETTDDGLLTASDETLRSLDNDTKYYIYLSEVKPENVKAVAGDGWVYLTWNQIDGATEYVIKDGDSNVVAEGIDGIANYYTITGLTNFKTYTYTVYARLGDGGLSAASDPVSATPTGNTIPQNVTATAGDGKVTLTWDAINGATAYVIKDGGTTILAKNIKDNTYTFTGLENGTTYTYTVYAYAGGKWSTASEKITAVPEA